MITKIQNVLNSLSPGETEHEAFMMLGLIFSFLFFIIVGLAVGQTMALIL